MNRILYEEPVELTLAQLRDLTEWSYAQVALKTGEDERRLYDRVHNDNKQTGKYAQWRKHLALIFKLSFPNFADIYKAYKESAIAPSKKLSFRS
jgi:hypothetical protein